MDDWDVFLRGLIRERFTHVPQATGPVEGPTSAWLEDQKIAALESVHKVVSLPVRREGSHRQRPVGREEVG